jgi:RNA polymerase sigma factor (sigma-70 family)
MTQVEFNYQIKSQERPLKGYAIKLTHNTEDANDLVQETFLRAIKNKDKVEDGTNIKGWLYTIMKNIFINNYRRMVKGNIVHDDTESQFYINNASFTDSNNGETKLAMDDINGAIAKLSDNLKKPFLMSFNGYKYEEIAETLAIPLGTVKIRIFNARKFLKEKLSVYGESHGYSAN